MIDFLDSASDTQSKAGGLSLASFRQGNDKKLNTRGLSINSQFTQSRNSRRYLERQRVLDFFDLPCLDERSESSEPSEARPLLFSGVQL